MALAQNPKVLLLDEPFAGLSIDERRDVQKLLAAIPREVTVVMIEHNMDVALDFADRITLLHFGEVIVEGTRGRGGRRSAHAGGLSWRLRPSASPTSTPTTATATSCRACRSRSAKAACWACIGRNGAGKSTCMNVAVGLLPPRAGTVEVFGAPVTRLAPEQIAAQGVALVPQGRRVFRSLTVRENLIVAARTPKTGQGVLDGRDGVRDVPAARRSGAASWRACSPAASSRCWPSAAR